MSNNNWGFPVGPFGTQPYPNGYSQQTPQNNNPYISPNGMQQTGNIPSASPYQSNPGTPQNNENAASAAEAMIHPYAAEYNKYFGAEIRRNPIYNMAWINNNNQNIVRVFFPTITEVDNLFTNEGGKWVYYQNDGSKKAKRITLFNISIEESIIYVKENSAEPCLIIIKYSADYVNGIALIPYAHFKEKRLREHFIIHEPLKFTPNTSNIINEYLYMRITQNFNSSCCVLYSHQGWNVYGNHDFFVSTDSYPSFIHEYLTESIRRRSIPAFEQNSKDIINEIFEIIPETNEVKLMMAIRAVSLVLFSMFKKNQKPQQIFLIESSDQLTLSIASILLKTNNNRDGFPLLLSDNPDRLAEAFDYIYDGIAVTFDYAQISSQQRDRGFQVVVNDMIKTKYSSNGPRHIHVVLTESASYFKDSESILHLHLPIISTKENIQKLYPLMEALDSKIIHWISHSLLEDKDKINDIYIIDPAYLNNSFDHVDLERRRTYTLIREGIAILNAIHKDFIEKEFVENIDSLFGYIDMSGNAQEFDTVNNFSNALNKILDRDEVCFEYLSELTVIEEKNDTILLDEDFIYLSSAFIDKYILRELKGDITHRQLIRALDAVDMLKKSDHFCQRLNTYDKNGNLKVIYRYAIKKLVLNQEKLSKMNNAKDDEFFLEKESIPKQAFIPLMVDKFNSERHVIRLLESSSKANNHIIITGEPGRGKSTFMIRTAAYLAEMKEKVIIFDSSGSDKLDELLDVLPEDIVNNEIDFYDIENEIFPVDPLMIGELKRKDSKANYIADVLLSVVSDTTEAQAAKLKALILENINDLIVDEKVSIIKLKELLGTDNHTLSSLRDKLQPLLVHIEDRINYEQTWEELLNKKNIIVFTVDNHIEKGGEKLFDFLLASLYNYKVKHKDKNIWICIDEIYDQNLKESGVINRIFTQGRKSRINIIGATHIFRLSKSEEWVTLNNAGTKVFFKPDSTTIGDVLKELDWPDSQRPFLQKMELGECVIKSELYSKDTLNNIHTVVSGKVPGEYERLKDIIPPKPQFGIPDSDSQQDTEE